MRLVRDVIVFWGVAIIASFALCQNVFASELKESRADNEPTGRYASIIIDMSDNEIIHARQIDELRYPASLTKVMTLYLAFEALEQGRLSIDQTLTVSLNASQQPASKLGLKVGQRVVVKDMINAMIVKSANDAAMVIAEAIGGSEIEFADMMSAKAWQLKMRRTVFKNPHGLTQAGHVTTARDMAKLGAALIRDHRTYYPLFAQKMTKFEGNLLVSSNKLLGRVDGVDGLKTGYTNASGYNLMSSAERDGHRIVAVVMGGSTGKARDEHMKKLLDRGFEVIQNRAKIAPAQTAPQRVVKVEPVVKGYAPILASSMIENNTQSFANEDTQSSLLPNPALLNLRGSQKKFRHSYPAPKVAAPRVAKPTTTVPKPLIQQAEKNTYLRKATWSLNLGLFGSERKATQYLFKITENNEDLRKHFFVIEGTELFQAQIGGLPHKKAKALCDKFNANGKYCRMAQDKAVKFAEARL